MVFMMRGVGLHSLLVDLKHKIYDKKKKAEHFCCHVIQCGPVDVFQVLKKMCFQSVHSKRQTVLG